MTDLLAIMILMFWPVIPLFWIPVHLARDLFRKIGLFSYLMPLITWTPLAYAIYYYQFFLLQSKIPLPIIANILGFPFLFIGTLLHIWTAILLGGLGIIGVPEISSKANSRLITKGPFSIVRHPTYLAHTLMFFGAFLVTEKTSVGIVALVDFIVVSSMIIPLEEKELLDRFGKAYQTYMRQVPHRIFPWMNKQSWLSSSDRQLL